MYTQIDESIGGILANIPLTKVILAKLWLPNKSRSKMKNHLKRTKVEKDERLQEARENL
jgi:hypothetical protein